jgi:hypothetical protein
MRSLFARNQQARRTPAPSLLYFYNLYISTNNIARGMVCGGRKYAFNSTKYVFKQPNIARGMVRSGRKYAFNSSKYVFKPPVSRTGSILVCLFGGFPMPRDPWAVKTPVLCIASGRRPFPSCPTSASRSTGGEVSILAYSAVQRCGGGRLTAGCGYRRQERGSISALRSTGGEVSILAYSAVQRCDGGGLTAGCGYRVVQVGARVVASTVGQWLPPVGIMELASQTVMQSIPCVERITTPRRLARHMAEPRGGALRSLWLPSRNREPPWRARTTFYFNLCIA